MTTPTVTSSVQAPPSALPQGNASTLPSTNKTAISTITTTTVAAPRPSPLSSATSNNLSKSTTLVPNNKSNTTTTNKPPPTTKKRTDNRSRKKNAPSASSTLVGGIPKTTLNAATAAAIRAEEELQAVRAREEGRKMDAIWIRGRDPIEVTSSTTSTSSIIIDEQAIVNRALLANGYRIEDVTPQAYGCLMEILKRYTTDLVSEAQEYAWHCGRTIVEAKDLQLAVELRHEDTSNSRPAVIAMAQDRNNVPLPPIPNHCYNGIVLPPLEYQLTARTFDVVLSNNPKKKENNTNIIIHSTNNNHPSSKPTTVEQQTYNNTTSSSSSYGANKSKQISVVLQSHKIKQTNITELTAEASVRPEAELSASSTAAEKAILNNVEAMSTEPTNNNNASNAFQSKVGASEEAVDTTFTSVEPNEKSVESTDAEGAMSVDITNSSKSTSTSEEATASKSLSLESKDATNKKDDREVVESSKGTIEASEREPETEGNTAEVTSGTTEVIAASEEGVAATEEPSSSENNITVDKMDASDDVVMSEASALPTSEEVQEPSTTSIESNDDKKEYLKRKAAEMEPIHPEP